MAAGGALFGTAGGIAGFGGTGLTTSGLTNAVGDFAGVFSGFQQAQGYDTEAQIYEQGASDARTQAALAGDVEGLQAFQLKRKVALTESAQRAAAATNGLQESGSVTSLLQESMMQGNEASTNLLFNTTQKQAQLGEQANAAELQASAAKDAASGSIVGGLLKGVGGIAAIAGMF